MQSPRGHADGSSTKCQQEERAAQAHGTTSKFRVFRLQEKFIGFSIQGVQGSWVFRMWAIRLMDLVDKC